MRKGRCEIGRQLRNAITVRKSDSTIVGSPVSGRPPSRFLTTLMLLSGSSAALLSGTLYERP